jgi:hypothetical protein
VVIAAIVRKLNIETLNTVFLQNIISNKISNKRH